MKVGGADISTPSRGQVERWLSEKTASGEREWRDDTQEMIDNLRHDNAMIEALHKQYQQ